MPVMFTMRFASIVLVEDHAILREGLRALLELEPDLRVVGEASTGADGVRMVQSTSPTLVNTDLAMPDGSGSVIAGQLYFCEPRQRDHLH